MKIGLVSPYDWSYPGGVQDHIAHLATELRTRGHTVRILTPATGSRGRIVEYGVYKLGWAVPLRVNGSVARLAIAPDWRGRIRGLLKREQFDVLHLHEPLASSLPITLLQYTGVSNAAYVGTFHAWARHGLTSPPEWAYTSARALLGGSVRRLDARIAVSGPARDFVTRFFPGTYHIIPNGVDLQRFHPDTAPLPQFADGKLNVLYLGRIEKRKGLKYLLRAIPTIRKHFPNTRFLIGSDGPLREGFERLVAQAGWQDVLFLGRVPTDDLPGLYASAHVYCAPSLGGESQGVVLLEALASGRAVVASDIPGYRSVIRPGIDGVLVRPKESEQLAWAICHLLGETAERKRYEQAAWERAQMFSWEGVGGQVEAVYSEALAHKWARFSRSRPPYVARPTPPASLPLV